MGRSGSMAPATSRRLATLALGWLLLLPTGCATRGGWHGAGWEAGMMGAMVVGGLILGRGLMHGGRRAGDHYDATDVDRFQPARLLEQRSLLELTDKQVFELEALREDVNAGRRAPEDAARAAFELLRPVQRAAVSAGVPAAAGRHHE